MDQIGKRPNGVQMVQAIKRAVPLAFGVNVLGAAAAVSAIDAWLNNRPIRPVD
jgi:hypothetical protein